MRKIALGLFVSLLAASAAFYNARAAWTDQVTVTGNEVNTGTADLQVSSDPGGTGFQDETVISPFSVSNLVPGGTLASEFGFYLKNNSTTGVNFDLDGKITALTIENADGDPVTPDQSQLELAIYPTGGSPTDWYTLAEWQSAFRDFDGTLNSGLSQSLDIAARLKSTALDEWQGLEAIFTITVNGTQE